MYSNVDFLLALTPPPLFELSFPLALTSFETKIDLRSSCSRLANRFASRRAVICWPCYKDVDRLQASMLFK